MDTIQPRLMSRALIGTGTGTTATTASATAAPCTPSMNPTTTTPLANGYAPATMRARRAVSMRRASGVQASQPLQAMGEAKGNGATGRGGGGGGGWWRRQLIPSAVLLLCTLAATIETAGANSCSYLELVSYSTCAGGKP